MKRSRKTIAPPKCWPVRPGVTDVYSLASVCPSRADQEENIQRWREFWTPERRDDLRRTLQQIGGELGFRPEAFAAFWKRLQEESPANLRSRAFAVRPWNRR